VVEPLGQPLRYSLAGTLTLTWPEVVDVARTAERLGFDTFYATDHLMGVAGFQPELGVLDALSLAVALGPLTERIRLGCMVSPVTMRHPVMLARALQTLDVITGGRAEIGLGAGWNAEEHEVFGFGFPAPGERLAMLAAAAETIAALWHADGPVSVGGRYPLNGAQLRPRPVQRPAPILIGGASKQSVAVAARLATGWNGTGARAVIAERITELRAREAACGRAGQVETSVMVSVRLAAGAGAADGGGFAGPPEAVAEYLSSFAGIGVQRIVLSTPRPWHPAKLEALAAAAGLLPAGRPYVGEAAGAVIWSSRSRVREMRASRSARKPSIACRLAWTVTRSSSCSRRLSAASPRRSAALVSSCRQACLISASRSSWLRTTAISSRFSPSRACSCLMRATRARSSSE
jgi:alkanesulfonate monooxygenase SsuD/methylene tetrahydromethanopterin reductase-like flavin-dependent oxidoreductase (luciferase family)